MTEITFRVPDTMVHLMEEWAKHIPEIEVVETKESKVYGLDDMNHRMALAFKSLKENGAMRHYYDYAWIIYSEPYYTEHLVRKGAWNLS